MTTFHRAHPRDAEFLERLAGAVAQVGRADEIARLACRLTGEYTEERARDQADADQFWRENPNIFETAQK